tara:strand:+ start:2527 stop:3021 length:495 start_codon:yes stop_codon:yes gene_type:complete
MPKAPPTFNAISLETADRRYKEEPGIVTINGCFPSKTVNVYNRSKYHIKIEIEHVPKPSFITSLMCGFRGANLKVDREQNHEYKVQRFFLPPVDDPMDAIMKPIHIMGGSYIMTSWMNGIKRDDGRLLTLNEYPVFQNRHYKEIEGQEVELEHHWGKQTSSSWF